MLDIEFISKNNRNNQRLLDREGKLPFIRDTEGFCITDCTKNRFLYFCFFAIKIEPH